MTRTHIILAGRFAPFGRAHLDRVSEAINAGNSVTILVTGADASRSSRLPWTAEERIEMCRLALIGFGDRVDFASGDDQLYDAVAANRAMTTALLAATTRAEGRLVSKHLMSGLDLEGASSLYLSTDDLDAVEAEARTAFFFGDDEAMKVAAPAAIYEALTAFRRTDWFAGLAEEHRYIEAYKASWAAAPYAPTFVTVDMVIVHAGRVLLIKRGGQPGRGLWALPGGFLDGNERLKDAALRELREETGLDLGWDDERLSLKGSHVFDDPERSARGRTITHAFHVELAADETPIVTGSDDAAEARWVPINDLPSLHNHFFEDHGHILDYFLKA